MMRIIRFFLLFIALIGYSSATLAGNIIPRPKEYIKRNGVFTILTTTKITHNPQLRSLAEYLQGYLPLETLETNESTKGNIALRLNKNLTSEGYTLEVGSEGITIEGGSEAGVICAISTLLQILPSDIYSHTLSLPVMVGGCYINDEPRFAYRGFMLDVSRTFIEVDELKRFIERLAHHKLNRLHLHLSDDEGWRIEIKSHPELTQIGGYRGEGSPVAARYGEWGKRYGGFYTQEQMRDIIAYASLRGVEIIPEIDLPGHSHNLARVMPEVLCRYNTNTRNSLGYDMRSALCVAKESNYKLLEDIFTEIAALFPSPYIHIGGDEVITSQWRACPDCRALAQSKGISVDEGLQEHFTSRIAELIEGLGKRPCVWNEAAESGAITRKAVVYGWESIEACRDAAAKGYPTVVMAGKYLYFDMRQSAREKGHDWAAIFDARRTHSLNLEREGFGQKQMENILGIQGSFFSELYISNRDLGYNFLDYQTYPRICALSEVAWSGYGRDWEEFHARLTSGHYSRMVAMGIDFRLFPPDVNYSEGVLRVTSPDKADIYYTIADSTERHLYTKPIATDKPHLYAFHTTMAGARSPEAGLSARFKMLRPEVSISSSIEENSKRPYSNAEGYRSLARTSRAAKSGDWILYTFSKPIESRRIEIFTGNMQLPRFIFNSGYAEVSYDGKSFERVGELKSGGIVINQPKRPIKAVKLHCTADGNGADYVSIQSPKVYPILK